MVGRYTGEELALAARNRGMPLEALRHDVTPVGLHYLLIHFDIPAERADWKLRVSGFLDDFEIGLDELKTLPAKTVRVTMECAGNGRGQLSPRYPSVPWLEEGVSTAEWTGAPLAALLGRAGLRAHVKDIVFCGADRGFDRGVEHQFARSLTPAQAMRDDVLLAYAMNGAPLPPQHGAPLRLVVPRWYGMASVKWLQAIEAIDRPFDGLQQASGYHFRLRRREGRALHAHARELADGAARDSRFLFEKAHRGRRRDRDRRQGLERRRGDRADGIRRRRRLARR
jgi:DMSO/TMAO reductase YedYZ molybdopterin-dependent catalytic subunit